MKKLLSLAIVAQLALFTPVKSHAIDGGDILGFALGLGAGLLLGNLSKRDQGNYNQGYQTCFDGNQCGSQYARPLYDRGPGVNVYIEPGQRLWVDGYPQARCRSFRQVVVDPRRGQQRSPPQVSCLDRRGQWGPMPREFQGRIRSYQDTRHQQWGSVLDRPLVLQPQQPPYGQRPPNFGPGFQQGPPSGPIYGGGYQQGPAVAPPRPIQQGPYVQPGIQRPTPPAVAGPARPVQQQQDCRVTNTCRPPLQQAPVYNQGQPPAVLPFGVR